MALPTEQAPGVHNLWLGDTVVTALSDGWFEGTLDMLTPVDKAELAASERAWFRRDPPRMQVNAYLVRTEGRPPVLVDAGTGSLWAPTLGRVARALQAAGVSPAEIRTVAMTHLHIDHCGGLIDAAGEAAFPNAELVLDEAEAAYWFDDGHANAAAEEKRGGFDIARRATAPYKARTRLLTEGEVAPGITRVALPGHTPGHGGYRVRGGGKHLLIWGDIVHFPGVQFALPDAAVGFDVDPDAAREARHRTMAMAADERLTVCGMHLDFPGFCHVVRDGAGYRWVPLQWQYAA